MIRRISHRWVNILSILLCASGASAQMSWGAEDAPDIFARENLVAWCIVPFDGQERGSAERAKMLAELGLNRVAYDWREKHVPTFEQEILEYQKHDLEYFAFWDTHPEALRLFKKYDLHPQIWQMLTEPSGETQQQRIDAAARAILPLVEVTQEMNCKLGLYNHGGWSGEPENLVAVCEYLRHHHDANHVGIVYNLHHAHHRIDDFAKALQMLKPYLWCLNLNGMTRDGDRTNKKILPLGEGEFDVVLLKAIRDSGYVGPIGIIGHTQDDVRLRLQDNLDGLDWILPQLDGRRAGPKPTWRTWSLEPDATESSSRIRGALLEGQAAYRRPPLTVECRTTLSDHGDFNILVANDSKASGAHWEIFTVAGTGKLTAYLPGMRPDHVHSDIMICDARPHTVSMLYEASRVRLLVDGQLVADRSVSSTGQPPRPDGLAIGRLVRGSLGCYGPIDWVRISRGIRELPDTAVVDVEPDEQTLLLWRPSSEPFSEPLVPEAESTSPRQTPEHSAELVDELIQRARQEGGAHRGAMVFSAAESACLSCHKVGHHGGSVGPDLTRLTTQKKPAEIVEAVLWPQRHVQPEYVARVLFTDDGLAKQGYVLRRDERQVVLRDPTRPDASDQVIPIDSIEEEQVVGSLMPDNLVASMSDQDLDNLLCFLLGLGDSAGIPIEELDAMLAHAHAHEPASFPYDREPLRPADWPSWQHRVNRDRVYDFYAKQADYFRRQPEIPQLLMEYPGLDGGTLGHWGNQNDEYWASDRWNQVELGEVQCGVFRGADLTIPRAVCVRLGDDGQMATVFNPDRLTYDIQWKDGFLKFTSFRHGFLDGVLMDGSVMPHSPSAKPVEAFEYHGFYRVGKRTVFAYRIGDVEHLDAPWCRDGQFIRDLAPWDEHPMREVLADGPRTEPEEFATSIDLGSQTPYAMDTIGLPTENPWGAPLFVGGLDFLPDGSVMVCTMHGDVWHVSGLEYPSRTARWRRFASGLHHPLGVIIDDDGIFVLGRDQITRLHDLNDDGQADFYECFSNRYLTSLAGHDFVCGLQRDANGNFYTASGAQGIVRISPDGKEAEVIAAGFRNPDGLGLLPDGTVTVPCSEGEWTPASMICAVRPSREVSFHGAGGPRNGQPPELPLVYLPRGMDNSCGGQTLVESDRWGPLAGQLLHFSFGTGSHFLVLRDEVEGQLQGAVVRLPGEFRSGVHRGRFSPADGQLYVGGMQGWGTYTTDDGCFQRVRFTGDDVQLPIRFRLYENGLALDFSAPLDVQRAEQANNHFAQCWNYRYSAAYGSPEFSSRHYGMRGHDTLAIQSAHVQDDGHTLFLEIPDLQPVNQLHLLVSTSDNAQHELFVTAHRLRAPFTDFDSYQPSRKTIQPHPLSADMAMVTKSVPNPFRQAIDKARTVRIETGTNLSYQTRSLRMTAGEPIEFTLANPDVVPHNWALVKPGTLQRVGQLANQLVSDPEAAIRHYIPRTSDVLAYTDVVFPREEFTIYFVAPERPGRYPFLCTFPGHWMVMNGEIIVEG